MAVGDGVEEDDVEVGSIELVEVNGNLVHATWRIVNAARIIRKRFLNIVASTENASL